MKKDYVLGLATGIVLAGASLVFANSQIQAIINNQIKVTLNGQVQEFRDETTNEIQYPITYKNRTYLPLRTVANLVGVEVDYDANTNTAILKTEKEENNTDKLLIGTYNRNVERAEAVLKVTNQTDNSIEFEINSSKNIGINDDSVNVGEISGVAIKIDDNKYQFDDNKTAKILFDFEKQDGVVLSVTIQESYLNDSNPYAGYGVTFEGKYISENNT